MNDKAAEKLRHHILDALDRQPFLQREGDCFFYEIYADYRDGMDSATATKLLSGDDPMQSFWESLEEWYFDYECQLRDELEQDVQSSLTAGDGPYPDGFTAEETRVFYDLMMDHVYFRLPEKHFLDQTFPVNIMLDTGDGNYDYVLNSVYPCWYGRPWGNWKWPRRHRLAGQVPRLYKGEPPKGTAGRGHIRAQRLPGKYAGGGGQHRLPHEHRDLPGGNVPI